MFPGSIFEQQGEEKGSLLKKQEEERASLLEQQVEERGSLLKQPGEEGGSLLEKQGTRKALTSNNWGRRELGKEATELRGATILTKVSPPPRLCQK